MKYILFFHFVFFSVALQAQSPQDETTIKAMVEAKRFVFVAQSTTTSRGNIRQLTGRYLITFLPDTIISDLPYFGRLYQAPMNSEDNGITFTSLKFDYFTKDRKKGGWDIKVKTMDAKNAPQLYLTIYPKGTASLRVNSTDRQSASYTGFIEEIEKK